MFHTFSIEATPWWCRFTIFTFQATSLELFDPWDLVHCQMCQSYTDKAAEKNRASAHRWRKVSRDKTKKKWKRTKFEGTEVFLQNSLSWQRIAKAYLDVLVRLRALFMSPLMGYAGAYSSYAGAHYSSTRCGTCHSKEAVDHRRNSPKPNNLGMGAVGALGLIRTWCKNPDARPRGPILAEYGVSTITPIENYWKDYTIRLDID